MSLKVWQKTWALYRRAEEMEKILLSWSSGKDSAMALYEIKKMINYEVVALLTTITKEYDRVSMHGVRTDLLEQQASSVGLPLEKVPIPKNSNNQEYEAQMQNTLEKYLELGVNKVAFGDLFLEDIRKYREERLAKLGMSGIFPLWKRDTKELAHTLIRLGFRAALSCIDSKSLDGKFAGREFDEQLLADFPPNVDPCGEYGEFHSFAYSGPIFRESIRFRKGEVVLRDDRFYYCDLIPV